MKITRANVQSYAEANGLEPIQIDGIPEGFSWKEPDITIAGNTYQGKIIEFKPLAEWNEENIIRYEQRD